METAISLKDIPKKLLNGYGYSQSKTFSIIVESSGAEINVQHTIEDSLKQIDQSSSDFLSHYLASNNGGSAETFTKLEVIVLYLIKSQLNMNISCLGIDKTWKVVDI